MTSRLLDETNGRRTFVVVFEIDDEVASGLNRFARENDLDGSHFAALGALRDVTLGWWNWDERDYEPIRLQEQVEVLTMVGNIARAPDGGHTVHAHLVIGRRDGSARGGHLLEAYVRPTLEVTLVESPGHLQRRPDPTTGLALIAP